MAYIVIELQAGETTANIVNAYEDRATAEQQYHSILAAAATSIVPRHSAVLLGSDGSFIKSEGYSHEGVLNVAYLVAELQTTGGVTANIINSYTSLNQAYQGYYSVLSAAAVSEVQEHCAVMFDEAGKFICSKTFKH